MCNFNVAWVGKCHNAPSDDFCETHKGTKCSVCKNQATHECPFTGQFVCGALLCDNCEYVTDDSKHSGAWGFMNHNHQRKVA